MHILIAIKSKKIRKIHKLYFALTGFEKPLLFEFNVLNLNLHDIVHFIQ